VSAGPVAGFPVQPDGVPWPTEEWARAELPSDVDQEAIDEATELAMADGGPLRVRATLIVHGGALVYERYSPHGADGPDVIMPGYSIAKSVTSAFIGILVRDGVMTLADPAPVPEWHEDPSDSRAGISIEQMLHMASGMPWTDGSGDPGTDLRQMLASSDMAAYAAAQQPVAPPGEVFIYNTGTTTLLARAFGDAVGDDPSSVRAFMDEELFDRIGMQPIETSFDGAGTWQGGTSADTTAQAFAKFGLLYLRGGLWGGERILPESWVEYSRTPSSTEPEYGAQWWLDPLRPGVSYAIGSQGQVITVDPAHDLVIVQLSTVGGDLPLQQTEAILQAFATGL
jgi:CubicO group peptidase (beta-lactamase class C family)